MARSSAISPAFSSMVPIVSIIASIARKVANWDYRVAKAFMDELSPDQADALSVAYRRLPSTADDARAFARQIWDEREKPAPGRTLGMVTREQAAAAEAKQPIKGLKAGGFDFSLSPDEVAHIKAEHGGGAIEEARGQRAITPDDFTRLPALLNTALPRFVGISDGHKVPLFEMAMQFGSERFVTRWEYWARRRTFTLLNFFVQTGEGT